MSSGFDPTAGRVAGVELRERELRGADLRGADLRGKDLHDEDLRDADLRGARTGPPPRWLALLFSAALVASLAIGVFAGFAGRLIERLLDSQDWRQQTTGALVLVALLSIALVATWKGGRTAMRTVVPLTGGCFVLLAVLAVASGIGPGSGALGAAAFVLLATAMIGLGGLARAVAGTVSQWAFVAVAMLGGLLGGWLGGGLFAGLIAIAAVVVGQSALRGRRSYPLLSSTVAEIACSHGTRFSGADLRGAHFEGTKLVGADFRGARLDGAHFDDAKISLCLFNDNQRLPPATFSPLAEPRDSARDAERRAPCR